MALENYLTYDKYDANGRLTVGANTIAVDGNNNAAYSMQKVFPANTFDGDFEHVVAVRMQDDGQINYGHAPFWGLSNEAAASAQSVKEHIDNGTDCLYASYYDGGNLRVGEVSGGSSYIAAKAHLGFNKWHYIEIERDESIGTYGALIMRIYDNVARTNLKQTATVALHAKTDYRTVYAAASYYPYGDRPHLLDIKDLDLGMAAAGESGSGSIVTGAAEVSGAGVVTREGVGNATTAAATVDGTGVTTREGAGAITTGAAQVAGTGVVTHIGRGAIETAAAEVSGAGALQPEDDDCTGELDFTKFRVYWPEFWSPPTITADSIITAGTAQREYSIHRICPPGTFGLDFKQHISMEMQELIPHPLFRAAFWGLSNNVVDGPHSLYAMRAAGNTFLYMEANSPGVETPVRISVYEVVNGALAGTISEPIDYNTRYYFEIERDSSQGEFGTLIVRIYSDAARENLVEVLSRELRANHTFRTQYAVASFYNVPSATGAYQQKIYTWPQIPQGRGAIVTGAAQVSGTGYSSPGGYEGVDYTTFDKNDIASHLVVTPHTVDVSGNNQWPFSLQYIYPEGTFGRNFTHAVSARLNSASGNLLQIPVWGVSNWTASGIHALRGLRDAGETFLCAYMQRSGNKAQLWLYEFHEGSATGQSSHINLNLDQWYHMEFERKVDDVLGVSTLRCRIYTDSMRTQELSGVAFDLRQPDETYRTLYGAAAWDIADGTPPETYSLNLKNLSLKIPVTIGTGHIVTGAAQVSGVGISSEAPPAIAPSEYAGLFGQRLFGQFWKLIGLITEPPAPTMPVEVASVVERRYRLEVHETWESKTGSTYIFGGSIEIPRFIDGRVTQRLNEAATLSLTVPTSEPCARYLRRPYLIRLYSPQGTLIETFVIWGVTESDDTVSLTALGLESNLARGVLTEGYHVEESEGLPVRYHIENLLAQQELRPIIGFGAVDVDIRTQVRGLHVDKGASILHALYQLHETVGGHIWVTPTGVLNWQAERGRDVGQDFVIGHNLANLKVSYDYSELVTKLFYYGQAEGCAKNLNLVDAGEADEFLLAEKAVRDEHGIITRVVVDTEVTDAAVLLSRAQRYLDEHKQPSAIYEADVLDLSHDPAYGFSDAKGVSLGDLVSLREEVKLEGEQPARLPGRHVQQHIVAIDRDLRHPASTRVTFGKMRDNLLDLFADLQSQLNAPPDVGVPYAQMNGTLDGLVGLRHGSIMFDKSDSMFKGLLLDPPDGRWPGADATLISLGSIEEGDIEEIIQQFIELNIGNYVDVPEPGENIQSVGTENSPGTGTAYARANHVHKMPEIGAVWLPFDDPYANWED